MLCSTDWLIVFQDNLSLTTLADGTHSLSWKSVTNYKAMLHNIPEEWRPHFHHSRSLKSIMNMTVLKTRNKIHWDYKLIQKTNIEKHKKMFYHLDVNCSTMSSNWQVGTRAVRWTVKSYIKFFRWRLRLIEKQKCVHQPSVKSRSANLQWLCQDQKLLYF